MRTLDRLIKTVILQFKGFSLTAKMLIGALMVIVAMALTLVAQFAGRSELVALGLSGPANAQARASAASYMQAQSISYEDRGDDLYVPVDQGTIVRGALTEKSAISTDQVNFAKLFEKSSPWMPNSERKTRYELAVMAELEGMISTWSSVQRARVQIAKPLENHGFGRALVEKSATATITTRSGEVSQELAEAVAAAVAGAATDLKSDNVTVIDARMNRAVPLLTGQAASADAVLRRTKETEDHVGNIVRAFYRRQIPGIEVAVRAVVDSRRKSIRKTDVLDPSSAVGREQVQERSSTNTRRTQEPGVRPNTTLALTPGGTVSETNESNSDTEMDNRWGHVETVEDDPGGQILRVNAIVGVPQSYVDTVYVDRWPDEVDAPDAGHEQTLVSEIKNRITSEVEKLLVTEGSEPGEVVVNTFLDNLAITQSGRVGVADGVLASSSGVPFVGEGLVRTGGLALLSFVSLALMFMMVRRAAQQEELPSPEELVGIPPALAENDSDLVGEAEEATAALEGMEVDEGDVRRNQMLDQINELAVQSPDETAALLRRWISAHDE